jgi:hypothetical protein
VQRRLAANGFVDGLRLRLCGLRLERLAELP